MTPQEIDRKLATLKPLVFRKILDPRFKMYRITSCGKVYSLHSGEPKEMAQSTNQGGYRVVTLCVKGVRHTISANVHCLVCQSFKGKKPSKAHQVRHLDGNRKNNNHSNLEWGTATEQWLDRYRYSSRESIYKPMPRKLSDKDYPHIAWVVENGLCTSRFAARALNMSTSGIRYAIKRGKAILAAIEKGKP